MTLKCVGTYLDGMDHELEQHVCKHFDIIKRIGKGAYGIVWKAKYKKRDMTVALKKIFDAFRNKTDAQRTFREIIFLKEFAGHPNIINLLGLLKAQNDKDIYLVFEYMESDLHKLIKRGNILRNVHKKYITYQILKAVKYIHSADVIHRDLKPSNILVDSDCNAKVCDFGLTRSLARINGQKDCEMDNPELTEYVATRWYRAPEILLSSTHYTKGVDMWSIGCILAEMFIGKALFPGTSTLNQLEKILSVGPKPTREDVECLRSDYGASILDQPTTVSRRRLEDVITPVPESSALDLVQHFLHLNPNKRLTAAQALEHPYVAQFRDPSGEIVMDHVVIPPLNDSVKLDISEYRSRLYEMINETRASKTWTKDCSSSESESASKDGSVVGLITSSSSATSVTSTISVEDSSSTTNGTDISTSNSTVSTSSNTSSRSTTPTSTSTLARSHSQARSSSQQRTVRNSSTRPIPAEKNNHSSPFRPPQHVFYGNETKKSGKFAVSAEIRIQKWNKSPEYPVRSIKVRNRQVQHDFSTNNANAPRRTLGYEDSNDGRTKQVAAISEKPVPYSQSINTFSKTYDIPMVLRGGDDQYRNEYNKKPPVRHKSVNPGVSKGSQMGTWAGPRRCVQWKVRNRSVSPVRSRIPQSQSPQYYQHVLNTSTVPKQTRLHRSPVARPWIA